MSYCLIITKVSSPFHVSRRKPGRVSQRPGIPLLGGTLTISIIPTQPAPPLPQPSQTSSRSLSIQTQFSQSQTQSQPQQLQSPSKPTRSPVDAVLAELQERSKLDGRIQSQDSKVKARPSDDVEGVQFSVKWEPQRAALGVPIPLEEAIIPQNELLIVSTLCVYP